MYVLKIAVTIYEGNCVDEWPLKLVQLKFEFCSLKELLFLKELFLILKSMEFYISLLAFYCQVSHVYYKSIV